MPTLDGISGRNICPLPKCSMILFQILNMK